MSDADDAGSRVSVREASPADLETIVRFNRALARETEGREPDEATLRSGVRTVLGDPSRGRYFVAERPGADGGPPEPAAQTMVTFEWSDWRDGFIWWIQSVYVHPDHRRRGLYRVLHAHVRRTARAEGVVGLRLYVDHDNEAAKATYRALGMAPSRYEVFEDIWSDVPVGS